MNRRFRLRKRPNGLVADTDLAVAGTRFFERVSWSPGTHRRHCLPRHRGHRSAPRPAKPWWYQQPLARLAP
jgi:hypothetical protein